MADSRYKDAEKWWDEATDGNKESAREVQKDRSLAYKCGITKKQLQELCWEASNWYKSRGRDKDFRNASVEDVVKSFLRPRTEGKGVSWALMRNVQDLSISQATLLVSHVWKESFPQFIENLLNSANFSDKDSAWICFCAIFQPVHSDDKSGPTITEYLGSELRDGPFYHVLYNPGVVKMIINQTDAEDALVRDRLWCLWEMFLALQRMKADDRFKVYMAGSWRLQCDSNNRYAQYADCSEPEDKARIRAEIEASPGGYKAIDSSYDETLAITLRPPPRAATEAPPAKKFFIFAGNPGTGKSLMLNGLMGAHKFESGVSINTGVTTVLQVEYNDQHTQGYIDTPGLNDNEKRKQAAEEITKALKLDGIYALFFVVTLEARRIRPEDKVTMKVILEACPEITKYSVIVNKLTRPEIKKLEDPAEGQRLRAGFAVFSSDGKTLLKSMPEAENVYYYKEDAKWKDWFPEEDGVLIPEHSQEFVQFVEAAPALEVHSKNVTAVNVESYNEEVETMKKDLAKMVQELAEEKAKQKKRR